MLIALLMVVGLQVGPAELDADGYLAAHREAWAALDSDRLDAARAALERCRELAPKSPVPAVDRARVEARAGRAGLALEWLERAAARGWPDAEVIVRDPDLAGLVAGPRCAATLERMRATARAPEPELHPIYLDGTDTWLVDAVPDPSGEWVAVAVSAGESEGHVRLLDAETGYELERSPALGARPWRLAAHFGGRRIVVLTVAGELWLWSPAEPDGLRRLGALPRRRRPDPAFYPFEAALELDPTGTRLAAAAYRCGGGVWSLDGELVLEWKEECGGFFGPALAWSPDGAVLWRARDAELVAYAAGTGAPLGPPFSTGSRVTSLALGPAGRLAATGHADARLRVWDLATRGLVLGRHLPEPFGNHEDPVGAVVFSPDGARLAYSPGYGSAHVLDLSSGARLWAGGPGGSRMGEPVALVFAPGGARWWTAFVSGAKQLALAGIDRPSVAIDAARPPRITAGGLALFASSLSVAAADARTGRVRWQAAVLPEGELVQAPTGHFTTELRSLAGLRIRRSLKRNEWVPLAPLAAELHDRARVRAARSGIELGPAWR